MTALTPDQIKQRLRYQGKQYGAGAFSRGYGYCEKHYLEQAADLEPDETVSIAFDDGPSGCGIYATARNEKIALFVPIKEAA